MIVLFVATLLVVALSYTPVIPLMLYQSPKCGEDDEEAYCDTSEGV